MTTRAQEFLKDSDLVGPLKHWVPAGEIIRKERRATRFVGAPPQPGQLYITTEEGELFIYQGGEIEFFVRTESGKEISIFGDLIKAGLEIIEMSEWYMLSYWGFCGIEESEDGDLLLKFTDPDFTLCTTHLLVNVGRGSVEYVRDPSLLNDGF
jgi:hypothetical protein